MRDLCLKRGVRVDPLGGALASYAIGLSLYATNAMLWRVCACARRPFLLSLRPEWGRGCECCVLMPYVDSPRAMRRSLLDS